MNLRPLARSVPLLAVLSCGCTPPDNVEPTVLFVQVGTSGTLKLIDEEAGLYELELTGLAPHVTYFSDRPQRIVGTMTHDDLVAEWNSFEDSFQYDPPNAALLVAETDKVSVFELAAANLDGATIRYQAKLLDSPERLAWKYETAHEEEPLPLQLTRPSLFIDTTPLDRLPYSQQGIQGIPEVQHAQIHHGVRHIQHRVDDPLSRYEQRFGRPRHPVYVHGGY